MRLEMTWTTPTCETHSCGMEVNMYAPDEEGEVLFRASRLAERCEDSELSEPETRD